MLLLAVSALALQTANDKICYALRAGLKPADLALAADALRKKVIEIGDAADLFDFDAPSSFTGDYANLFKVRHGDREWFLILDRRKPENDFGATKHEYWIGVKKGKVAAVQIPPNPDDMIGPIRGEWRRTGNWLLGAGDNIIYHSAKWQDAEIDVLAETATGIRRIQHQHLDTTLGSIRFRSTSSTDVIAVSRDQDVLKTIDTHLMAGPKRQTLWKFDPPRYRPASSFVNPDATWAFDHLMTAIVHRQDSVIRQMIPNAKKRPELLHLLRKAWHEGCDHLEDADLGSLVLINRHSEARSPSVVFAHSGNTWYVKNWK